MSKKDPYYVRAQHKRENNEAHQDKVMTKRRKADKAAKLARRRNRK